jgi:tRNA-specific 2-thiouridylase
MTQRVLVAMSGGVDSSVTAALLQKQGMEVEGITMKLTAGLCCDIGSAQSVCNNLNIPHRMIDAQVDFSRGVIAEFISEYSRGRTPNPCILCNDLIKFHLLLHYARDHDFDYLATGHYARTEYNPSCERYLLKKGIDEGKDQSYFLYRLTQDQMKNILFPLGEMRKTDVRTLARELALPAAERPESQEICFIPENDYRSYLKENAPDTLNPGKMILTDGTLIGKHDGIAFFTIGQRRHLRVSTGERLYVVRLEPDKNRVVLGNASDMQTRDFMVKNLNFILINGLQEARNVMVKIRYRSPLVPARIEPVHGGEVRVLFEHPVKGICPGQAAVFYDDDKVVGGGIIDSSRMVKDVDEH